MARFGDDSIGSLKVDQLAKWRKSLPAGHRHHAHRALRQVLEAAVRWKWVEDNPALLVKNPAPKPGEIDPFDSWKEIDAIAAELTGRSGALVVFLAGTGVRPEEAFGGEWRDVDLKSNVVMVRRAFAKGRLKDYTKTTGSRRAVPLRAVVLEALTGLDGSSGYPVPGLGWGADRPEQLSLAGVDAGASGDGDRASAHLRPAPHVRDVEPRGGH